VRSARFRIWHVETCRRGPRAEVRERPVIRVDRKWSAEGQDGENDRSSSYKVMRAGLRDDYSASLCKRRSVRKRNPQRIAATPLLGPRKCCFPNSENPALGEAGFLKTKRG
jgi:hypothetical protein